MLISYIYRTEKLGTSSNKQGTELSKPLSPRVQSLKHKHLVTIKTKDDNGDMTNQDFYSAKKNAKEKRKTNDRVSSTSSTVSVHSRGVGANGPLSFSQYLTISGNEDVYWSDSDNHFQQTITKYDKGIGAHGTPPITRKPYNAGVSVTTWF